ncbi:MAG: guanylate kinase [Bdellovibrionaceae bacterium]|nr:guanylate kinase [Pseudobdellovibrionaceae bacterium]|tara:strand:+ start:3787 stop:4383 length:597 start_codon:yes stop_codon:yes gene_type:complete
MNEDSLKTPILIVISAPSGAGKTTLCRRLLQELQSEVVLSISTTTRPPRKNEINGTDYHFINIDQFKNKIKNGDFIEWAEVHGQYYGTSKTFIEESFSLGQSVLLDIDVQGAESFRNAFPDQTLSIFIAPPTLPELKCRLKGRGTDSDEEIEKRISNAKKEMKEAEKFDKIIINDNLENAYQEMLRLVTRRMKGIQSA